MTSRGKARSTFAEQQLRRQSASSISAFSSTSSGATSVYTPRTEDDYEHTIVAKVESPDEEYANFDLDYAKPVHTNGRAVPLRPPRNSSGKQSSPSGSETKKTRSKTGCITCRNRKKKCDEGKPECLSCRKNNYECEYEVKQKWKSKKSPIPTGVLDLPTSHHGINDSHDQKLFEYYRDTLASKLSFTHGNESNPFLHVIVPIAMEQAVVMHSMQNLSASCLILELQEPARWMMEKQVQHRSSAIACFQQAKSMPGETALFSLAATPAIAATLLLCLETLYADDTSGGHRLHMTVVKRMLIENQGEIESARFRAFAVNFALYHDCMTAIISAQNPLDERTLVLIDEFESTQHSRPQIGVQPDVRISLFRIIYCIRAIRDEIRQRTRQGVEAHWWQEPIYGRVMQTRKALEEWQRSLTDGDHFFAPNLLYFICIRLYFERSIEPTHPLQRLEPLVDKGVQLLAQMPWDDFDLSLESVVLMPLFMLGCTATQQRQRAVIEGTFERLRTWSGRTNIQLTRRIVHQLWQMMDRGREAEIWNWEEMFARQQYDFLLA